MPFPINRPWIPNITGRLNPANVIVQTHTLPPSVSPQTFGYEELSPAWLEARLVARYGARLYGLWLDPLVAAEWPARVGGTAVNTDTTNRFTSTTINGRAAFQTGLLQNSLLAPAFAGAYRTAIMVVESSATVVSYETWCGGNTTNSGIGRELTGANYRTADGYTHYVDGTATEVIPTSGVHVVEGIKAAGLDSRVAWGGINYSALNRSVAGKVAFGAVISDAQSAGERAATLADLRRYYRIAP